MYDLQYYISILKNNNITEINTLLDKGLNIIFNNLNIIDILLLTDEITITQIYNNINKDSLPKFFYIPETKYNPFYNLINLGYFKNIITLIDLLSIDFTSDKIIDILQYQENSNFWIIKFLNECDYSKPYIYNFFKRYSKEFTKQDDNLYNYLFNFNFIVKFASYDYYVLDNIGYFKLLSTSYKYVLEYPISISYLIELIAIYYDSNNIKLLHLIERLIQIYPEKLDEFNKNNLTALYVACNSKTTNKKLYEELIKLIIKYKRNYDKTSNFINDFSVLLRNVSTNLLDSIDLTKIKIDYTYQDIYRSSYGHIIFNKPDIYPDKYKVIILENSDLTSLNSYRQSILHLLFKNDDYKKYISIILNRNNTDNAIGYTLFIKDNFNLTPIEYIKNDSKETIYLTLLKPLYNNNKNLNKLCHKSKNMNKYFGCIKKNINYLLPDIANYKLAKIHNTTKVYIFNNYGMVLLFYNILMLKKYRKLGIYYTENKSLEKFDLDIDKFKSHVDYTTYCNIKPRIDYLVTKNYISIYSTILWYDKNLYYIPDDIFMNFDNLYNKKKMTHFYITLTLLLDNGEQSHINVLFFDYINKYVIRFESHGLIYQNVPKNIELDEILNNYVKKYKPEFIYYRPKDYLVNISFQLYSEELMIHTFGTPNGFCMAWIYWFIETMLSFKPNQVNSIKKIAKIMRILLTKLLYETNPALYIKAYANNKQNNLVKFFTKHNIPAYFAYKICYDQDEIGTNCNKLIEIGTNTLKKLLI